MTRFASPRMSGSNRCSVNLPAMVFEIALIRSTQPRESRMPNIERANTCCRLVHIRRKSYVCRSNQVEPLCLLTGVVSHKPGGSARLPRARRCPSRPFDIPVNSRTLAKRLSGGSANNSKRSDHRLESPVKTR